MKWRYYCVEQLVHLPRDFQAQIKEVLSLHSVSVDELARRKKVFMKMWEEMKPAVEKEVQMTFEEMLQVV